jgi:hypothetical protein
MSRASNSSTTALEINSSTTRSAHSKMAWSFSWEFGWSPAAAASAQSLRHSQPRTDELGYLLDKALAYAG